MSTFDPPGAAAEGPKASPVPPSDDEVLSDPPSPKPPVPLGSVVAGVAAVVMLVAAVGLAVSGRLERRTPVAYGGTEAGASPATTRPPADVSIPLTPAPDPERPPGAARISFDGPAALGLSPDPTLGPWYPLGGLWGRGNGTASVVKADGVRSLVVLAPAVAPTFVQVTLAKVDRNGGLVVRFQDATHYVVVVPLPRLKAVWVQQVDGDPRHPTVIAAVPHVTLRDGVVIAVRMTPTKLTLVINGVVARVVSVPAAPKALGLGITATGRSTKPTAAFDDLYVATG